MRLLEENIVDYDFIADACGVSKQAVSNWLARHEEFAACVVESRTVHILFDWSSARKWLIETGRLDKKVVV
jgi:hypothetical protein